MCSALTSPDTTIAGRYELGERLDAGGWAEVWTGRDLRLKRDVAVKLLRPRPAAGADARGSVEAGARAAANLNHPNIVVIYDSGEHEGVPFLVMERLSGRSLADEIAEGPLRPERVRRVAGDVLAALESAHAGGVVHGDLKPARVLLCPDGSAKVSDFGLAGDRPDGRSGYLAPERREGGPTTAASDLYSLGVILHQALTGRLPSSDPPPESSGPSLIVPDDLAAAVAHAMENDPARRFTSASEMAKALGGPMPSDTQPLSPIRTVTFQAPAKETPRPDKQRQLVFAEAAALTVALFLLVARRGGGSSDSPPTSATTVASQALPAATDRVPPGRYRTSALAPALQFTLGDGWSTSESEAQDVVALRRREPGRGDLELSFLVVQRVFRSEGRYSTAPD